MAELLAVKLDASLQIRDIKFKTVHFAQQRFWE
jgi:hypothetical protein